MTILDDRVPGAGAVEVSEDRWHGVFIAFVTVGLIVATG